MTKEDNNNKKIKCIHRHTNNTSVPVQGLFMGRVFQPGSKGPQREHFHDAQFVSVQFVKMAKQLTRATLHYDADIFI